MQTVWKALHYENVKYIYICIQPLPLVSRQLCSNCPLSFIFIVYFTTLILYKSRQEHTIQTAFKTAYTLTRQLPRFFCDIAKIVQREVVKTGNKETTTMVIAHNVKGYDEFRKLVEELENAGSTTIHVLFSGGKDENGHSWCPYCVKAEPVVHEALGKAADQSHFIHVDVGERTYWKDVNCPFRKDPNTHLVFLPTLLRWKSPQRLDGERVSNKDLVEMMFEDED